MNWFAGHAAQIALVIGVAVFLSRAKKLVGTASGGRGTRGMRGMRGMPDEAGTGRSGGGSALVLWAVFAAYTLSGLILGSAMFGLVRWLTSLGGAFGGLIADLGGLIAVLVGWRAVKMLVDLVRDLMDGRPDEEARRAALWVPTLLPAGFQAVLGIVQHPRGVGTGLTAALMGVITIWHAVAIIKAALKSTNHKKIWKWFCVPVALVGGLMMIPLVAYVDGLGAQYLPQLSPSVGPALLLIIRVGLGGFGLGLLFFAVKDIADREPDAAVRMLLLYGLPLLFVYGALTVSHFSSGATSGTDLLKAVF